MDLDLTYSDWRQDLQYLYKAVGEHGDKDQLQRLEVLRSSRCASKAERKKFVADINEILSELDSEGRDMFFRIYRDRKYMQDKTQVRINKSTREQLKKIMTDFDWPDYDYAISELIEFIKKHD